MKVKILLGAALLSSIATQSFAQYTEDVFRFSNTENSSTARFNAMGGQQTSLGGDLSSIYGNPAGLGMFSKSEFAITTGLVNNNNKTDFLGQKTTSNHLSPSINNIGVVFHTPVSKFGDTKKGLLSYNFGIGYQRNSIYRNELNYSGETYYNGLSDYFTEDANAYGVNDALTKAAFDSYIFNPNTDPTGPDYVNNTAATSTQVQNIVRKGGQSNFDLSLGLNFSNNFYLGFGVGLASINYRSEELLTDDGTIEDTQINYYSDFLRSYDTQASGVNFKVGTIFRPINSLRLGLSLETPTYYTVNDRYYEELYISDENNEYSNGYNNYDLDYSLRTPLKLNAGASYVVGSKGLITADISFRDYSSSNFESNSRSLDISTKQEIKSNYKETLNFGIGGEYKVTPEVALRAGYKYIGDPYEGRVTDFAVNRYSGGVGYKIGNYSIDAAVMFYNLKSDHSAYSLPSSTTYIEPIGHNKNNVTNISLTFAARF